MITSTANKTVKHVAQLNKKGKLRNEEDVFIVEGRKMFSEVPRERVVRVYASTSFLKDADSAALLKSKGVPFEEVSDDVLKAMSDTQTPQGILCVVKQYHYRLEDFLRGNNSLFMVLENLQDPGNLGTIMRTSEGAGVTAVILSRESVDIYNPKTIRSTMGSIYRVPFLYVEDLKEVLKTLAANGVRSYAAHLKGKNTYDGEDYKGGTAFLIGNEGNGLTDELSACADTYIRIPMEGQLESLNAAVSAAILMYEAHRQRA